MTTNQERKWPAGTADKMNEWAERQLGLSLEPWQMDLLRQIEVSKPRTLAEMTRDEWKACQWMQADFDGEVVLLTKVSPDQVAFLHQSGTPGVRTSSWFRRITPLPELRRMVWPKDTPEVEEGTYGQALWDMVKKAIRDEKEYHIDAQDYEGVKRWRDVERALSIAMETNPPKETPDQPRPEDVPVKEPWLVEFRGERYIGARDQYDAPNWALARMDGTNIHFADDHEVTLVYRLVPDEHHPTPRTLADMTPEQVEYALAGCRGMKDPKQVMAHIEKTLLRGQPRPEDVPAGELWLVETYGERDVAERELSGEENPWWLMRGWRASDKEVTLVSRLVPEAKA